jgi:hypothetical protein
MCSVWIQFDNEPRSVVYGETIKEFLGGQNEMTEEMGEAVIRVMRRDEGKREPYEGGFCHHVLPKWAVSYYNYPNPYQPIEF